jgi:hypothetical protein
MSENTKTCTTCQQPKPATLAHFNADRRTFDGLTKDCADCIGHIESVRGKDQRRWKMWAEWIERNREAIEIMSNRIVRG